MIDKAKEIIREEIKNVDCDMKEFGEYLLVQLEINEDAAERIVKEGKTINGAFKEMASEAKRRVKVKKGEQQMRISDKEGYKIMMNYFGVNATQEKINTEDIKTKHEEVQVEKPKKRKFHVDVNSL